MSLPAVRAAFRIARRDALRAKGRSILILLMVGLPMLAIAFVDVMGRTIELPPAEEATRVIGAADLVADKVATGPVEQPGRNEVRAATAPPASSAEPPTTSEVAALLPAGSRVVEHHTLFEVRIAVADAAVTGDVHAVDLGDAVMRGIVELRNGAFPRTADEVALTPKAASTLRVAIGGSVDLGFPAHSFRVTGIVREPSHLSRKGAYVLPSAAVKAADEFPPRHQYAVDLPTGVRDLDVLAPLQQNGFAVEPRTWFFDPPESTTGSANAEAIGVLVVIVGLATLEVVLLAGAAFAVGARRRQRDLALVAATGGDRKDVRRVVLAGGVVLGATAGVAAIAGAVFAVGVFRRPLEHLGDSVLGPLDLRWLELGAIVAVAVGTALLAAAFPARQAARQPVVAALTGRRGQASRRLRVPVIGLLAVAIGTAVAFVAAGNGTTRGSNFTVVLAGAVLAELGFVACAPAAVGLAGRLGSRLPVALRLAARDAARHRTRSGPAVAAIVAAVAGSVAISVYAASDVAGQRRAYKPRVPAGVVDVVHKGGTFGAAEEQRLAAILPIEGRVDMAVAGTFCLRSGPCDIWFVEGPPSDDDRGAQIAVSTPEYVELVTGRDDGAAREALKRGEVVVFDPRYVKAGQVTVVHRKVEPGRVLAEDRRSFPAYVVRNAPALDMPQTLLTLETAAAAGMPSVPIRSMFRTSRVPTEREEAQAAALVDSTGLPIGIYVERGFKQQGDVALLVLLVASAVVTVGATGIATGLAAADSRPDLATLAAVGAPPRVRRRLAMAQAVTVAALGSALGILAGLVPALSIIGARPAVPLALPFRDLAITAVGVPLLAALLVGAVTRSRLPMARRLL